MGFITNADELQALLDACSQTREWELLIQSILIPDEYIAVAYARLLELTAGAITKQREKRLTRSFLAIKIGYINKPHTQSGAENFLFQFSLCLLII